jgi:AcrR family transcriptional regulator
MSSLTETLARRAVERSVADRQASYVDEIERILDATYRLIERTGTLDPSLREILKETGLSTQAFYRCFQSKDELLLLVLDDGRRQLVSYLEHRMARARTADQKVREWIEGVLAQAADPTAATRTRPFVANEDRLAEAFPEEHQASVDALVQQLATALDGDRTATAIYVLIMGALHRHLTAGTRPSAQEIDDLVAFSLGGARALAKPRAGRGSRSH